MHSADPVSTSPVPRLYPCRRAEASPSRRPCSRASRCGAAPPAPVAATDVTGTAKHADTATRSSPRVSGPAAMSRPCRTRPPWVNPGGISSQWWVTRTTGGLAGSRGQRGQPDEQPLAGAQIEPGERLVEQDELGIAHQGPGQEYLLALALRDHPERPVARYSPTPPRASRSSARSQSAGSCSVSTTSRARRDDRSRPPRGPVGRPAAAGSPRR